MEDTTPTPEQPEPIESTEPATETAAADTAVPVPPIVEATDTTEPIPSPQVAAEAAAAFDAPPVAAAPIPPVDTVDAKQPRNYKRIAAGVAAGALTLGAGFALGTALDHEGRDGGQSVDGGRDGDHRGGHDDDGDGRGVPGSITQGRGGQMGGGQMQPGQGGQGGMGGQMQGGQGPQTHSGGS
jgi:hypothetical protein